MRAPKVSETPEQAAERERAETNRLREIQEGTADRTATFRRINSPRLPISGRQTIRAGGL